GRKGDAAHFWILRIRNELRPLFFSIWLPGSHTSRLPAQSRRPTLGRSPFVPSSGVVQPALPNPLPPRCRRPIRCLHLWLPSISGQADRQPAIATRRLPMSACRFLSAVGLGLLLGPGWTWAQLPPSVGQSQPGLSNSPASPARFLGQVGATPPPFSVSPAGDQAPPARMAHSMTLPTGLTRAPATGAGAAA